MQTKSPMSSGRKRGVWPRGWCLWLAWTDKASHQSSVQPTVRAGLWAPAHPCPHSSHSPHCSTPAWNPSSLSVLLSHCISWLLSTRPGLDEANSHPGHKTKGGPNAWGCAKAGSTLGVEVSSTFVPGDPCSPYPCPNSAYWPQNLGQSI